MSYWRHSLEIQRVEKVSEPLEWIAGAFCSSESDLHITEEEFYPTLPVRALSWSSDIFWSVNVFDSFHSIPYWAEVWVRTLDPTCCGLCSGVVIFPSTTPGWPGPDAWWVTFPQPYFTVCLWWCCAVFVPDVVLRVLSKQFTGVSVWFFTNFTCAAMFSSGNSSFLCGVLPSTSCLLSVFTYCGLMDTDVSQVQWCLQIFGCHSGLFLHPYWWVSIVLQVKLL